MKQTLLPLALLLTATACAPQVAASGCEDHYQRPNIAQLTRELADAQSRWKARGPSSYRYVMNYGFSGEVSGQHEVQVREGQVVAGSGDRQDRSMEGLFAGISATLAEAAAPQSCVMLTARYDPTDGHITEYSYQNAARGLMDAFGGYRVSRLEALPPAAP